MNLIHKHLPRPIHVEIEPETELTAIGFDDISRMSVALDIEEITGRPVPDREIARWHTAGDVMASAGL